MIKPVILSGGKGSRLWPLSREQYPKQYLSVGGDKTLFQQTVERIRSLKGALPPLVICSNDHRFLVAEQLQVTNMHGEIVLEPVGRDTAPAVAVAALLGDENDLLLVMPADHVIPDNDTFLRAVRQAAELAGQGFLVTFGIPPHQSGNRLRLHQGGRARRSRLPHRHLCGKTGPGNRSGVSGPRHILLEQRHVSVPGLDLSGGTQEIFSGHARSLPKDRAGTLRGPGLRAAG